MRAEQRPRLRPMTNDMRERRDDLMREGHFRDVPKLTSVWVDQGMSEYRVYDRLFRNFYTPYGVYTIYQTFVLRMRWPRTGDSKRLLRREIQSNPHLHGSLKANLLKALVKASVRFNARGHKDADSDFGDRIRSMVSREQAKRIRDDIDQHPCLPAYVKANLLDNLRTYETGL